jgi:hypothetical protein
MPTLAEVLATLPDNLTGEITAEVLRDAVTELWELADAVSGTTAARPDTTTVGFTYFDTTLGLPIWWDGADWVDATGTPA